MSPVMAWAGLRPQVLAVVAGMALVTYLPRVLPMTVLSRLALPEWFRRWLSYVPVAVLSALLAPALILPGGRWQPGWSNPALLAAVPTFVVAYRTRGLFTTVLTGLVATGLLVELRRLGLF